MSKTVDNITLALLSLKELLETFLDDNGWVRKYTIGLAGDPNFRNKELVVRVTDRRKQIMLPLITIETGLTRNEPIELGDSGGQDVIFISILFVAKDENEMITLSNIIRRKILDLTFDVLNFTVSKRPKVGTATLINPSLDNISDPDAANIAERFVSLLNSTMEINASDLI